MTDALDGFLRELAKDAPAHPGPGGWFSPDGDCVFYFQESTTYFAERVDSVLTVYRADDDQRIVGVEIKGISRLPKHDLLGIHVSSNDDIDVVQLILLSYTRQRPPQPTLASPLELEASKTYKAYLDAMVSLRGGRLAADALQPA